MEILSSDKVLIEKISQVLHEFSEDKKVAILSAFIRVPGFDYRILYSMLMKELKKSAVDDDRHHQEPSFNIIGVKLMDKPTVLRFKVRPPPDSENKGVIKNQKPQSSKLDLDCDDQQEKTKCNRKVQAFSSLDKNTVINNQKPILGNPKKIGPKRQRIDLDDDDDYDDHEENAKKKKKKTNNKKKRVAVSVPANMPPPDMPPQELEQLMNRVNGSDPVFVIQKRLFPSDVNPGLARLSLPLSKVNHQFLTEEEKEILLKNETIETNIFEPCGEKSVITLTKWNMGSPIYNLIKTWNDLVVRNRLEDGMVVQLWSFRLGGSQLCLFLTVVNGC